MEHVGNAELVREEWSGGWRSGWEEIRANSSEMIRQEMTQYRPHTTPRQALGEGARRQEEKPFLITEPCQSAVGEDDEIIKHFPCVFFIRPVLFFFQVLGKQNRSPASTSTTVAASPGSCSCPSRRGALGGIDSNTFLMEIMICKALFIPFCYIISSPKSKRLKTLFLLPAFFFENLEKH